MVVVTAVTYQQILFSQVPQSAVKGPGLPRLQFERRSSMRRLADDLHRAARALARAPLFAGVAVISLGLALALNTTMFALADAVLHPYLPYPRPDRIATPVRRAAQADPLEIIRAT